MNPNDNRPPAAEPEPSSPLADVTQRLRQLRPAEPDLAARERVWSRISAHVGESEPAVVAARLQSIAPADPSAAISERVWDRLQRQLREDRRRAAMPALPARRPAAGGARRLHPGLAAAVVVLIVTFATVSSVAQAALPGFTLYPVKRGWEDVQWSLTLSPLQRAQFALVLADRRRAEAESLVGQGGDPALVAATLADALAKLNYAAAYLPAEEVGPHLDALQHGVSNWPDIYQLPVADDLDALLTATPAATGVIPTAGALSTQVIVTPVITRPALTLPAVSATPQPPTAGSSQTPAAPAATASQPLPTPTLPAPTPTPLLGLPLPTLPLPTLPLPTVVIPTLPLPTLAIPTLPLPTVVIPTLPLPTVVLPTLGLPQLFPTATPRPPGAGPTPTRTPLLGLPLP